MVVLTGIQEWGLLCQWQTKKTGRKPICYVENIRVGIVLFILVFLIRYIKVVPMEWNSLITTSIGIVSMIALTVFVNNKIKEG